MPTVIGSPQHLEDAEVSVACCSARFISCTSTENSSFSIDPSNNRENLGFSTFKIGKVRPFFGCFGTRDKSVNQDVEFLPVAMWIVCFTGNIVNKLLQNIKKKFNVLHSHSIRPSLKTTW